MDQTSPPATPSPSPVTLGLARGQSLWLCLAPGSALRTARGEVAVRFAAPQGWSQLVRPPAPIVLKAGATLPWASQEQAAWVQVENLLDDSVELQLWEGAPAPGLLRRAWQGLHTALAGRSRARAGRTYGTTLHAAR